MIGSLTAQSLSNTAAFLLGCAVVDLFPEAKLVESSASSVCFFYDVELPFSWQSYFLPMIQEKMLSFSKSGKEILISEMMKGNAKNYFLHLGQSILAEKAREANGDLVTVVKMDSFADLADPEQLESTNELSFFRLIEAIPKGDNLVRVLGLAAFSKEELKEKVKAYTTLEKKDHLEVGRSFFTTMDDNLILLQKGAALKEHLLGTWRKIILQNGFDELSSSSFENVDLTERHIRIHKKIALSRTAEYCKMRRSISSDGLLNSSTFVADRVHSFCGLDGLSKEVSLHLQMIKQMLSIFPLYNIQICTTGSTRQHHSQKWISLFQKALQDLEMPFTLDNHPTEYRGPAIQMTVSDVFGRNWPVSFLSLFARGDGSLVIASSLIASIERVIALLLEKSEGALSFLLSPVHVQILCVNETTYSLATSIKQELFLLGLRVDVKKTFRDLKTKVYEASCEQIPYLVILGEKEKEKGFISLRRRGERVATDIEMATFIEILKEELNKGS